MQTHTSSAAPEISSILAFFFWVKSDPLYVEPQQKWRFESQQLHPGHPARRSAAFIGDNKQWSYTTTQTQQRKDLEGEGCGRAVYLVQD